MKSTLTKFFEQLQRHLDDKAKGELVVDPRWANQGNGYIQDKDGFTNFSKFSYDFQDGYATFIVNGKNWFARFDGPLQGREVYLESVIDAILAPVPDPGIPRFDDAPACPRR